MASFRKRGNTWRVEVYSGGQRESATFKTKQQAAQWALEREAVLSGDKLPDRSLGDAMRRYAEEISPGKGGAQWEQVRLAAWQKWPIAGRALATLDREALEAWRDGRLAVVKSATVRREFNLLTSVLTACVDWRWLDANPMKGMKRPPGSKDRKRRVSDDERDRICAALGYFGGTPETVQQRVAVAFLFALETAMRSGEIVALHARNVFEHHVHIEKSKNGDARDVALSPRAKELLALVKDRLDVFGLTDESRDTLFRRARDAAQIADLTFHDSRHEAITRLSRKLDVLDLARMIGHRDLKSLMIYYNPTPEEMAKRLAA